MAKTGACNTPLAEDGSVNDNCSGNDTYNYTITAELRSLSTGAPHTLAQEPALRIVDSFVAMEDTWIFDKLVASLEIVGSRILILVRYSVGIRGTPKVYDRLICVEWMLGRVLAVGKDSILKSHC